MDVIEQHYTDAVGFYPKLRKPFFEDGYWVIYGFLDVIDGEGNNWETYEVKIVFPDNFPEELPVVFEESGKIERTSNWHINPDGTCCLGPRAKLILELPEGITLKSWIDRHVIPFLANHTFKVKQKDYASGEYKHGAKGIFQYYMEWLNVDSEEKVVDFLQKASGAVKIGRNSRCFCGSEQKYKKCHIGKSDFRGVRSGVFKQDLRDILVQRMRDKFLKTGKL